MQKLTLGVAFGLVLGLSGFEANAESLRDKSNLFGIFQSDDRNSDGGGNTDLFEGSDSNGDSRLDKIEYADMMEERFNVISPSGDAVTWDQLNYRMRDVAKASGKSVNSSKRMDMRLVFRMMDRNKDEQVSFSEYQGSLSVMFANADKNRNGSLSRKEFDAATERVIIPAKL